MDNPILSKKLTGLSRYEPLFCKKVLISEETVTNKQFNNKHLTCMHPLTYIEPGNGAA